MSNHNDALRCAWDEEKLAYRGGLRMAGWTIEELITQGMIDIDTYPFDDDHQERFEIEPLRYTSRSLEELLSLESIDF
jgi:hypothetical protein